MPVQFVAEVSSNHNVDIDRCYRIIEAAARSGCSHVKFQLFRIDRLFAPEIVARRDDIRSRREWELPEEYIPKLAACCRDNGIGFSCTPFYVEAVAVLAPHVDFFKIASYELLRKDLLGPCSTTGLPLVLSTGMATLDEVADACRFCQGKGVGEITLLHCVSNYPVEPKDCNLAAIETLRRSLGFAAGWSDHSVREEVIARAVHRWGATMIEFHFDLEGKGREFGMGHCWLPESASRMIKATQVALEADGDGSKEPRDVEATERLWRADPADGLRPFRAMRGTGNRS